MPGHGSRVRLDQVVVGLDDSAISERVAAWSAKLCKALGAAATILHCIDPGAEHSVERLDEITTRSQLSFEKESCAVFRGLKVDHQPVVENGDPRICLIETAERQEAGLIVVGQRGSGQFSGLGGTASYLVRHSPLPLAVIPPPPNQ
ncbi:MAG: universal stress protein [Actinomycetota bacterium]|nr:universal stress protein [Actinomycetota bacterium]